MNASGVKLRVEGFNHARLLTRLQREQISVLRFVRENAREFSFWVYKKDKQKTFAILNELCYTYNVVGEKGLKKSLLSLCKRAGLLAGIVVFSVAVAFSRNYIWRVEITGNENIPDKVIENVLATQNIAVGKKLSRFDADAVCAAVRAIDGIKLVSSERKGTTVFVEVFESDRVAPPLAYQDTDIVSQFDATVTRVIAREGTALEKQGQHVFRDTPLIGAYRKTEEGVDPVPTHASGIVYGKVAYTESVTVATEWMERVPVSSKRYTRLHLFGLTIGKKLPSGAGVEIAESSSKLNVFLPVRVSTARITQTELRKKTATADELAERAENEVLLGFISEHAPTGYSATRTVRDIGGGLYLVNVFVEAEIVIGGA